MDPADYRVRIVTPEQWEQGYVRKEGDRLFRENYILIGKLRDGNYLVQEPHAFGT